jgi:hypothetical protein
MGLEISYGRVVSLTSTAYRKLLPVLSLLSALLQILCHRYTVPPRTG